MPNVGVSSKVKKDFEKWIGFSVGDFCLAADLRMLREQKLIGRFEEPLFSGCLEEPSILCFSKSLFPKFFI
jgi:hypothetical protein